MAINKFMRAAIKAISYADFDLKENYRIDRVLKTVISPPAASRDKLCDYTVPSRGYEIPLRLIKPRICTSNEILLFIHGGGWVTGSIDTYTRPCAALADATGRRVFSIDYRLAPEFPYPCAVEDCYAVLSYIGERMEEFGIPDGRLTLAGDSAGGNLAAAVSLMARDRGGFVPPRQILIYPSTAPDHSEDSPFESIRENGTDYLLTSKNICDYIELYNPDPELRNSPYFAPLLSEDLSNQPDTLVLTAEFDPLRDEGEEYARRLFAAGNNAALYRMKDALHGFFTLPVRFVHVQKSLELIRKFLEGEELTDGEQLEQA